VFVGDESGLVGTAVVISECTLHVNALQDHRRWLRGGLSGIAAESPKIATRENMVHAIVCGDIVNTVGGKYAGRSGHVVKITVKMYAIKLYPSEDVVRVKTQNVELHRALYQSEDEAIPRSAMCQKACCKARMEALRAMKEELQEMRNQMTDLVMRMEQMGV
jgi:preprotein translocase subunit YajC